MIYLSEVITTLDIEIRLHIRICRCPWLYFVQFSFFLIPAHMPIFDLALVDRWADLPGLFHDVHKQFFCFDRTASHHANVAGKCQNVLTA